jgi:DUF1680 family protein
MLNNLLNSVLKKIIRYLNSFIVSIFGLTISVICISAIIPLISCSKISPQESSPNYLQNRPPLVLKPYLELPLGSIKPDGWLLEQLKTMKNGLTGHLDEYYEPVVGLRNGWLGGDGDGWERGPYWLDGLVPLAYILNDPDLKAKVKPWIEWSLKNQADDGYFGPVPFEKEPEPEPGLQKTPRLDWWPKMVMLKVLQQYYSATGDKRVIKLMTDYFHYQLEHLPETPLDNWSFWANRRGGDNLMIVYWLYNITGEKFLLELANLIHKQTFPWTDVFLNEDCYEGPDLTHLYPYNEMDKYPFDTEMISRLCVKQLQSFHCVNLAQGIKEPIIYYQQHPDPVYINAVKKAFRDIKEFHGQPQGMFGGDEPLHGKNPTQGIELCSVVELMFSLENILTITGDIQYAEYLEKITYNALPAQIKPDFMSRQYFQSANQVMLTRYRHNFYEEDNHGGTDLCFGLLTGYPCCLCNMHQGWPKFVQNLFYSTQDNGIAAFLYAPCHVNMLVADSIPVKVTEETNYPFDETITFTFNCPDGIKFPLHLRIPGWCSKAEVRLNNEKFLTPAGKTICTIDREWYNGDQIKLILPMEISFSRWVENSIAVERGPLLYSLRIFEEWSSKNDGDRFGPYEEVRPLDPWNYGLLESAIADPLTGFKVIKNESDILHPWSVKNTPIEIRTTGKIIPDWGLYNEMPGPLPHSLPSTFLQDSLPEEITLIPYGCTKLRITEFPVVK